MYYESTFILLGLVLLFKFKLLTILTIYFVYLLVDFFLADFFLASLVLADLPFLKSHQSLIPMLPLPLIALPSVPPFHFHVLYSLHPALQHLCFSLMAPSVWSWFHTHPFPSRCTCMKTSSWDPHTWKPPAGIHIHEKPQLKSTYKGERAVFLFRTLGMSL